MEVPVRPGRTMSPRPDLTRGPLDPRLGLSNEPPGHSAAIELDPENRTFNTPHPFFSG